MVVLSLSPKKRRTSMLRSNIFFALLLAAIARIASGFRQRGVKTLSIEQVRSCDDARKNCLVNDCAFALGCAEACQAGDLDCLIECKSEATSEEGHAALLAYESCASDVARGDNNKSRGRLRKEFRFKKISYVSEEDAIDAAAAGGELGGKMIVAAGTAAAPHVQPAAEDAAVWAAETSAKAAVAGAKAGAVAVGNEIGNAWESGEISDAVAAGGGAVAGAIKSGATSAGNAIANGANAVASSEFGKSVASGATTAGNAIASGATTAGNAIANGAKNVANSEFGQNVASGATTAGKAIASGAQVAGQAIGDAAVATYDAVKSGEAKDMIVSGAKQTGDAIVTGANAVANSQFGQSVASGATTAGNAVAKGAKTAYDAAKPHAQAAAKMAKETAKQAHAAAVDHANKAYTYLDANKEELASDAINGVIDMLDGQSPQTPSFADLEACVGCLFVWEAVKRDLGEPPYLTAGAMESFEQFCQDMPDVFYESCDDMMDQKEYLAALFVDSHDSKKICDISGICGADGSDALFKSSEYNAKDAALKKLATGR